MASVVSYNCPSSEQQSGGEENVNIKSESSSPESIPEIKRGRGRPKKYSTVEQSNLKTTAQSQDSYSLQNLSEKKRSRGRPRKNNNLEVLDAEGNPKRKRGRPRKNVFRLYLSEQPKGNLFAGGDKPLLKNPRGRPPKGSNRKYAAPSGFPPIVKRRGRPPGSLNKVRRPKFRSLSLLESLETISDPDNTILRLTGRHFPDMLPGGSNLCQVCLNNSNEVDTVYCCSSCNGSPPLCAYPCFETYHTVFRYWQEATPISSNNEDKEMEDCEEDPGENEEDDDEAEERNDSLADNSSVNGVDEECSSEN